MIDLKLDCKFHEDHSISLRQSIPNDIYESEMILIAQISKNTGIYFYFSRDQVIKIREEINKFLDKEYQK